jgi:hypothetical protein
VPDLNTLLDQHVTLVYESVDRVFLNGYVAKLQEPDQLAWFLGQHRGEAVPRYEMLGKMTRDFVAAVEQLAQDRHIPLVTFEKGQRKETIAEPYFAQAALLGREGVVLIGVAQEKANVSRPPRKERRGCGGGFAAGRNSAFVKHLYLYIWDRDFGPHLHQVLHLRALVGPRLPQRPHVAPSALAPLRPLRRAARQRHRRCR